jgi:AcrR family transcriptional regulator
MAQIPETEIVGNGAAFDERRARIVDSAAELFDRDGYAQTSMNAIADAVGMRKPTLYHYFDSKAEILLEIHLEHVGFLFTELARSPRGEVPPQERLRRVVRANVELMRTRRHGVRVFFEHARELEHEDAAKVDEKRRRYRELVIEMIEDGIQEGVIRESADPYYATMVVFGISNWVYQWFERDQGSDPDHLADILWDFVWPGLRA